MKRNLFFWQFAGFSLTTLAGTILHFLYDWTNQSPLVAPFSGINESTWEHMKLLFWPLLLFAAVQSRYFRDYDGFWCVKLIGITAGLVAIPVLFYTYNGAVGPSPDWLNITFFFVAAALAFLIEGLLLYHNVSCSWNKLAIVGLLAIGGLFVLFTFLPPSLPLFQEP